MIGVRPADGFESMAPKGVRKARPHIRTAPRAAKKVKSKIAKKLPARTIHKNTFGRTTYEALSVVLKKPAMLQKKPSMFKKPAGVHGSK